MHKKIKSKEDIQCALENLASTINADYKDAKCLDIICFINGASFFSSDLVRFIDVPIKLHYLGFSSYSNFPSSGEVKIEQDVKDSLENKHILLLEGLVISGKTPLYLLNLFKLRNPASIKICAVGVKRESFEVNLDVDYHMFNFKDEWIEGYGIGNGKNKSLPYLADIREH
mgnify:CR=1 FL=1